MKCRPAICGLLLVLLNLQVTFADEFGPVRSVASGNWSSPKTWEDERVPTGDDVVQIQEGTQVVYDVASDDVIRSLHVSGTLSFDPNKDTLLNVGLIRIDPGNEVVEDGFDCDHIPDAKDKADPKGDGQPGFTAICVCCQSKAALLVGTPERPISAEHTARIRLHHIKGRDEKSWPAIVCCGGRMEFHGAPMNRTWVKLGATAAKGDTSIKLAEPVTGWRVGDRIIVTATHNYKPNANVEHRPVNSYSLRPGKAEEIPPYTRSERIPDKYASYKEYEKQVKGKGKKITQEQREKLDAMKEASRRIIPTDYPPFTEEFVIQSIDGDTITLDKLLRVEHLGEHERYRGEVANLSRNVIVESADPDGVRGHTMYHRYSAGSISYAEFRHLGKENTLGRYAIHFHLVGDTMRGSYVQGASIWDSHNRWITIHGTQYLIVRDCVGYQSVGHGFFLEDGTEVYNVLDRNLAVHAYVGQPLPGQVLPYDPNDGSGFWWANPLNTFTRNVAAECDRYGFHYEVKPYNFPIENLNIPIKLPIKPPKKVKEGSFEEKVLDPKNRFCLEMPIRQPDGSAKTVDVRKLPFIRFDDNEAHSHLLWAVGIGTGCEQVGPDHQHPLVIRNLNIWKVNSGFGIEIPSVLIEGMNLGHSGNGYTIWFPIYRDQQWHNVVFDEKPYWAKTRRRPGEAKSGNEKSEKPIPPPEVETADLNPVDDLPPITVVTHAQRTSSGSLLVRGSCTDNGDIAQVHVNGKPARSLEGNFARWEIELADVPQEEGLFKLSAHAEDQAGNVEKTRHEFEVVLQ